MREILFRGIRKDTHEWVYGFYGEYFNGKKNISCISIVDTHAIAGSFCYEVIPETVGQFTGLTDKNGNRIFEGDVLKMEIKSNYINPLQAPLVFIGVCKFKDGSFGFSKQRASIEEFTAFSSTTYNVEFEIIGNIHDNADLLK